MNNQDWERFGEDIRRTIQDAVEYGNYDRLNQTITNTVNQAVDWVNKNVTNKDNKGPFYEKPNYSQQTYEKQNYQQPTYHQPVSGRQRKELFRVNSSTKVSAILFTVFGYAIAVPLFIWSLIMLIGTLALAEPAGVIVLIPSFVLLVASGVMAGKGTSKLLKINRFNKYKKEIGNAELCNISRLSVAIGKTDKYVVKDVEKMIENRWFCQGHLDKQKTCLMVTDKVYHQYQELEDKKEQQRLEAEQRAKEQQRMQQNQAESRKALTPEVQKIIAQGDAYVQKIRECNDAIPGEEISEKIYRIEVVVDKIFDRVEQNPDSVADIRKLMDYYLPTTVKLLEAYAQMDAQPVGGTNIQTAKKEIEATLDTLNVAFEKLLDSLFQEAAWDVSSDISVLNTMLAQEGLKEDGLKK